jgi:hypothetical protein
VAKAFVARRTNLTHQGRDPSNAKLHNHDFTWPRQVQTGQILAFVLVRSSSNGLKSATEMNVPVTAFALFEPPDQLLSINWYSTMLLPGIILLFGAIFYLGGRYNDNRTLKTTPTRWIGVVLVAISFWLGLNRFMWTTDLMYGQLIRSAGRKFLWSHYMSLILPVIGILIIVFLQFWDKKQKEYIHN